MGRGAPIDAQGDIDRALALAREGDAEAFAIVIRHHDERMRGLAFRLLGDRELMDDALQEAYLRAFRALPEFRGEAQLSTWLYRVTYNACIDEIRRRDRARKLEERALEMPVQDPVDHAEPVERASVVRAALLALPPEERAVAWLVDGEGLGYREVATILDLAEGTIASRLSRARAALREALAGELRPEEAG